MRWIGRLKIMSRSYKKTPYSGDHKGKWKKRRANEKVRNWFKRNLDANISRGDFRKIQNPWDICDFYSITTFKEYWQWELNWYEQHKNLYNLPKPDKKKSYRKWYKGYKMK